MGLELIYELRGDTARILRCFGEMDEISIPAFVHGFPVTELGDYLFSEGMRTEPAGRLWAEEEGWDERESEETAVWEEKRASGWEEKGTDGQESEAGREERASGQKIEGASGQGEKAAPGQNDIPSMPALCGPAVRAVRLPAGIRRIGRYAFYNCDGLYSLSFFSNIRDIGAGAFNGCRKIEELSVEVLPEGRSCLKEILSELNETVAVHYREGVLLAELLFPAFYEEAVENTPARITETHVHGCGHRYRYCFKDTRFQFREYDSMFPYMRAQENTAETVRLAVLRLRYPAELSPEARKSYQEYLLCHLDETAEYIASLSDASEWEWLVNQCFGIKKVEHAAAVGLGNEGFAGRAHEEYSNIKEPVLGKTGFDKLVEAAARLNQTEAVGILMDIGRKAFPPKRRSFEL